jgi:probable phosphoglycerate mutase
MAHGGRPGDRATRASREVTVAGRIWLVRHAPTDWTGRRWCGRSDPALSKAGRAAADRLAAELAVEITADLVDPRGTSVVLVSSPSRRAVQTAEPIARALAAPIHIEHDLAEVDFGTADGLTWDELVASHPSLASTILAGTDPDWPDGETRARVAARARRAAGRLLDRARSGDVVAVSHGGLLRALAPLLGTALQAGIEAATAARVDPPTGLRFEPATAARVDPPTGLRFEPATAARVDPTRIG